MKKYILGFGLPLTALALMSFSNSDQQAQQALADGIKITCPSGDHHTCYEGDGFTVYKGDGDATIEFK